MENINAVRTLKNTVAVIIEDDKFMADLLKKKLENSGAKIVYANSGETILEVLKDTVPSLFIIDILLPGMDGFDTLQKIRSKPKLSNIPAIMLSNLKTDEVIQKIESTPHTTLVIKSDFNLDELLKKIQNFITA